MHHGLNRHEWLGRSVLMAHLANINRDSKQRSYKPADFDIYDSRGRLKQARHAPKPTLAQFLSGGGVRTKGSRHGPDPHRRKDTRP